ncbi:MAG: alpha,2-mannosyltransferase [Streptosporangiaceae bacterium]|nr:alpha,2-mannosyltransferase [Streptosporangiaceae bacterium]
MRGRLAVAGIIAFAVILGSYLAYMAGHPYHWTLDPVDLGVYQSGGLIVRHVRPLYNPHLAAPLYDWRGYQNLHLKFTYTPFAAVVFALVSFVPWRVLPAISVVVSIGALLATLWFTFGWLGYRRGLTRLGATLLAAAAVFWTEPVLRTIYLGQVNLVLMALIIWDLGQPDTRRPGASRWWKGAGVGVAAGIKLVPLIFVPYLLLTRRFRAAAVACAAFAATVAAGFVVAPADSGRWWLGGLFFNGGRTGFVGWEGNQSLRGLLTRLAGSVAGAGPVWLAVALVTAAAGLACAALLDRAGHPLPGLLACALTGLLVSPISWDHHWVWIVPGVAVAAAYAVRAMHAPADAVRAGVTGGAPGTEGADAGPARVPARAGSAGPGSAGAGGSGTGAPRGGAAAGEAPGSGEAATASGRLSWRRAVCWPAAGYWALAVALLALYGAWPGRLWGEPSDLGQFSLGLLWQPPNTDPEVYYRHGDRPWFAEYHWHGIQLLTGNAFLLGGLALLGILIAAALRTRLPGRSPSTPTGPTTPRDTTSPAPSARTSS